MSSLFSDLSSSRADGAMLFAKAENKKRPGRYLAGIFLFVALAACTAVPSAAFAARGHELCSACKIEPTSEHAFSEPSGVAVSETAEQPTSGDVYVIDTAHNRVEYFNEKREWAGEFTGPSATGTGKIEAGSTTIMGASRESGAFSPGEELSSISAPGFKPGTTITAVEKEGEEETFKLTLSEPAESEEMATLDAHQSFSFPTPAAKNASGIAVDSSCALHKPKPLTGEACVEFDPSNGDVYVADPEHGVIDKFSPEGVYMNQVIIASVSGVEVDRGIAVDSKGELWADRPIEERDDAAVTNYSEAKNNEYSQSETHELAGGGGHKLILSAVAPGFAVDAADDLYVNIEAGVVSASFEGMSKFNAKGEVIEAPVGANFEVASGAGVEFASSELYADYGPSLLRYSETGEKLEELAVPGGGGAGVAVRGEAAEASTVYVANPTTNAVDVFSAVGPSAPAVTSEGVTAVSAESASFTAGIDTGGAATEYTFQYGPCTSVDACASSPYPDSAPVPDAFAGSDFQIHEVGPLRVLGLTPGSAYHFRVVVHNTVGGELKTVEGPQRTFTTQAGGGSAGEFVLPDNRAYEMVSPPDKHGAALKGAGGLIQAAAGGGAIAYQAQTPVQAHPLGYQGEAQVLSTRGSTGWVSRELAGPHEQATGAAGAASLQTESFFFSEDLSRSVLQPFGGFVACRSSEGAAQPCLSAAASEQTPFLQELQTSASTPLVTGCPAAGQACAPAVEQLADVPPGTVFGQLTGRGGRANRKPCPPALTCGPQFVGASPDASHVVIESYETLTHTAPGAPAGGLYEWSAGAPAAGRLQLISVLPDGVPSAQRFLGSEPQVGENRTASAVSGDGSHVVWSDENELFLHDLASAKTIALDAAESACLAEPGSECESGGGIFQSMNTEGTRVLFTDQHKLTKDAGAQSEKPDLYECEISEEASGPRCVLRDLTPVEGGEPAAVQGAVLGSSSDGTWVYFVADGVQNGTLNTAAVHGDCKQGFLQNTSLPGATCDLYVRHDGVTRLVTVVSGADGPDWNVKASGHTSRVAPDGEWAAFMSQRSLTGYDTRDAAGGRLDEEVYEYHAPPSLGTQAGGLRCASCDPTGARPHGVEFTQIGFPHLVGGSGVWPASTWFAANTPAWTSFDPAGFLYQSRYLDNQGRLFFDSSDALVPKDVNGQEDVYEYEPKGVGDCAEGASNGARTFEAAHSYEGEAAQGGEPPKGEEPAGCVGLISSGASSEESAFLDASETGGDVFFLSSAKLTSDDTEGGLSLFDAHECTSGSPCPPPAAEPSPPCNTEASCKASPTPQPEVFGAPASATFSGPGNLRPEPTKPSGSSTPPCSSSLGTPSTKCTKKQNLKKALATCKRKYPKSKKKRASCEATARHKYGAAKKATAKKSAHGGHG